MSTRRAGAYLADGATALVVTAAAAGACATVWWLGSVLEGGAGSGTSSAAVLATVVALSLGRRTFASRAEFARSAVALPVVGLLAGVVGLLLVTAPPVGAALFVAGMSIPIWLRRFGPRLSRLGRLVALPFTAMLIAPIQPQSGVQPWVTAALVLLSGVVATAWVAVGREVLLLLPDRTPATTDAIAPAAAPRRPLPANADGSPPTRPAGAGGAAARRRLPASTRMALQMASALAAAFVVGWIVFPEHAMWVVLTAFLVCSGNRGRADVLHRSALRILGALAGTLGAVALTAAAPHASGFAGVAVIFVALFAGTWLRTYSYAFWALTVTLVLSLLQQLTGTAALTGEVGMLAERMLAIVVGAALSIAASWFILPVRSIDVLRRRLSELLVALAAVVDSEPDDAERRTAALAAFRTSAVRLEELAPAHRATRLLHRARPVPTGRATLPIDCIEAAGALPAALDTHLAQSCSTSAAGDNRPHDDHLRTTIRRARGSLAEPVDLDRIGAALHTVARTLASPSSS
ncbi:FUSC family protein [Leifsonia sp. SIMBA_070]|uniref:FUSC family protein n=1 Tax=Leifsonia sp. SIMBA_070 TaxID=3085810 RepID=UPI00397E2F15